MVTTRQPPGNTTATVTSCIGIALELLDDWLSGRAPDVPPGIAHHATLGDGHWIGERAATDILVLAGSDVFTASAPVTPFSGLSSGSPPYWRRANS